jgi:hypothetical protein
VRRPLEVRPQGSGVCGTGPRIAEGVQLQRPAGESQRAEERIEQRDDLDVGVGVVRADDLGVDLVVLAVSAGLG